MDAYGLGSIKKIFGRQREPYGFLTIHHPKELQGDEAVFYLKDVVVSSEDERRLLQGGMMVRFSYVRKPVDRMKAPCPFKAIQVRPQDPMKYSGTVAKTSGGEVVVFLDILFRQARVYPINQTVDPGDRCIVTITWKEMIRSIKENRDPFANLVVIEEKFNSYFSSQDSPGNSCKRCRLTNANPQWIQTKKRSNIFPGFNFSSSVLSEKSSDFTLFGSSLRPSIWSNSENNQIVSDLPTIEDNAPDADWYLRTIRMAEAVLYSGAAKQK